MRTRGILQFHGADCNIRHSRPLVCALECSQVALLCRNVAPVELLGDGFVCDIFRSVTVVALGWGQPRSFSFVSVGERLLLSPRRACAYPRPLFGST